MEEGPIRSENQREGVARLKTTTGGAQARRDLHTVRCRVDRGIPAEPDEGDPVVSEARVQPV